MPTERSTRPGGTPTKKDPPAGSRPAARHVYRQGSTRPAPKHRGKGFAALGRGKQVAAIAAGTAGILALTLLLVLVLVPNALGASPALADGSDAGRSRSGGGLWTAAQSGSGVTAITPEVFVGTVLPETEDAGEDYVKETLFLGDSNTLRMLSYHDVTNVTLDNGIGVTSMGITAFKTLGCAKFQGYNKLLTMPEAVELLQPRRVVMTFGTNNTSMQVAKFIEAYTEAIEAVQKAYPHADIIIGSIFPVDQYRQYTSVTMKRIDEMNLALVEMAEELDVKFLNWGEALLDEKTGHSLFECTVQDGIHLTRSGMERIFTYFRTHSYVTEDTRPRPLKTIPKRLESPPGLVATDPGKVAGPIDWESVTSKEKTVDVVFSTWDSTAGMAGGGTVSGGELSGGTITLKVEPGATAAAVTAKAAEGYEFVSWSCSVGSITDIKNPTLPGFFVETSMQAGQTIKVTATFRKVSASASSASSSSSSSSSSSAPSSSAPSSSSAPPASSSAPPASSPSSTPSEPPASSSEPTPSEPPASSSEPAPPEPPVSEPLPPAESPGGEE